MSKQHEISYLRELLYKKEEEAERLRDLATKTALKLARIENVVNESLSLDIENEILEIIREQ